MLRSDVGKLHTERVAVMVDGLKIATPSEYVKLPDEVSTVLGSLGPTHIRERRADVLDPLSGVHIVIGDGDIVMIDDAVGSSSPNFAERIHQRAQSVSAKSRLRPKYVERYFSRAGSKPSCFASPHPTRVVR